VRRRVDETAEAMRGRVTAGDPAAVWDGAAFDSREVEGGELFFALPGEATDGHRFVGAAAAAGAAAAVVHRDVEPAAGTALIRVGDTYQALHALARAVRRQAPDHLVAITGSAGKTTTKELVAAVLGRRFRVAKNEGNLNNLYGFPLSLLGIPDDTEWMVAEMGMSSPGELSQLSRIGRPDAVVFTNVRPVHLEFFGSLHAIAEAKAELLEGLDPGGLVVANADDPEVARFVRRHAEAAGGGPGAPRVVWYGRESPEAQVTAEDVRAEDVRAEDVRAEDVAAGEEAGGWGSRFRLRVDLPAGLGPGGAAVRGSAEVRLPIQGTYNVINALAAAACGLALGVPLDEVVRALAGARPAKGRGEVHRLPGGPVLIDDSYNSNPDAVALALASAAELAAGRRRTAVLGDMLELGPEGPRFHREAGETAAELGFSPVAGVGELSRELVAGAEAGGAEARWFATAAEAAEWAAGALGAGDLVLVKGSRGVGLDAVVARLLAVPVGTGEEA